MQNIFFFFFQQLLHCSTIILLEAAPIHGHVDTAPIDPNMRTCRGELSRNDSLHPHTRNVFVPPFTLVEGSFSGRFGCLQSNISYRIIQNICKCDKGSMSSLQLTHLISNYITEASEEVKRGIETFVKGFNFSFNMAQSVSLLKIKCM